MAQLDLDDIQGIILSGYRRLPWSAYLFLHFPEAGRARAWLAALAEEVTFSLRPTEADGSAKDLSGAVNLAFTAAGLAALGLDRRWLETFPQEFLEGMAREPRPRRLGDTGASAPERWEFGGPGTPAGEEIHALLILQAPPGPDGGPEHLDRLCAEQEKRMAEHGIREVVLPRHVACRPADGREHFGFRDGISQPVVEGSPNRGDGSGAPVRAGEFVLGWENEYGVLPQTPVVGAREPGAGELPEHEPDPDLGPVRDLGRGGSFLVFRKLAQDVAAFRRFLRDSAAAEEERALLAARLVGRWPGGAPVALADRDDPALAEANDFDYAQEDPRGYRCPMTAHIRRANPRGVLIGSPAVSLAIASRHRILRRGAPYGERLPEGVLEDDGRPRGLLFLCVNADLERQFEFVQQTWINNPKFGGLYSDSDPIAGANAEPGDSGGPGTATLPGEPLRRRLSGVPRFVTTRGGGYFFLPGRRALRFLSRPRDA